MIGKAQAALALALTPLLGLGAAQGIYAQANAPGRPGAGAAVRGAPPRVAIAASPAPGSGFSQRGELDTLLALALERNPGVRAAAQRVEAAQARIPPAGALPDPMLGIGVVDFPVWRPGFSDNFTMKMVGATQTFPFPGKLGLRRRAAEHELQTAQAMLAGARRRVQREVKQAYYELAFLGRALEILEQNQQVLVNFIQVTESRYAVGVGVQQDVLKARVEAARLGEEAVGLAEARRAALARLNALLDRPSDAPVTASAVPAQIARAAVAESPAGIRFASRALGARAADSPLPPLAELQEAAVRQNPELLAHEAEIRTQAARVELARKEHLPDFDLSFQYGQRDGFQDLVTAMVSVPIPWQKGRKQDLLVKEAEAALSALESEHRERANSLRGRVAELHAELERTRAQLALYVKSIIPQGRAALTSAMSSFQVGRADFLTLLENQATLYNYETAYFRGLTDFATKLAELEEAVGMEILS